MNPEDITQKKLIRSSFMEFLGDFKEYLAEYVRESVFELVISEMPIHGQVKLFDGYTQGKVKIKNQGDNPVFLSTTGMGGYKLNPGDAVDFWLNSQLMATTVSGTTVIGFIKS